MARNTIVTILLGVIAAAAVMVALGGCSGAGSGTPTVSGASVKTLATGDVSGVLALKQWMDVFYRSFRGNGGISGVVRPKGAGHPKGTVRPQEAWTWPDPSPNSDGSTNWSNWFDDGSGYAFIEWPDGRCKLLAWGPYTYLANGKDSQVDTYEWWRDTPPTTVPPDPGSLPALPAAGTIPPTVPAPPPDLPGYAAGKLWYIWYSDFFSGAGPSHQVTTGASAIPGGFGAAFTLDRTMDQDIITATYSDGSGITVTIPLTSITNVSWAIPDYAKGATGTMTSPGLTQSFTVVGVNTAILPSDPPYGHWTTLTVTSPDGTTAQYALATDSSGSGQLTKAGQLLASLLWDSSEIGTLRQVGMDAAAVAPSEAARRFAVERFIYSAGSMGPGGFW